MIRGRQVRALRHAAPGATARSARAFLTTLLILTAAATAGAAHLPLIPETGFEIHTHGRLFYSPGEFDVMAEYVGRFEDVDREFRYQSLTLGSYYRLLRNLKVGAFYRLQFGARHDDDWIADGVDWFWVDAARRAEHLAILDATPRFLLDFLPGESWVASLKARYEYNFTNAQQTLLVRPGLTWFWVRSREPVLNVSTQYTAYFSLNFGDEPWYRHGPYVNLLYHLSPNVQIDASLSRQWIYWSESADFVADHPAESYTNNVYSPWLVDVGMILRFR
mgnify:CR=1 FL=1